MATLYAEIYELQSRLGSCDAYRSTVRFYSQLAACALAYSGILYFAMRLSGPLHRV